MKSCNNSHIRVCTISTSTPPLSQASGNDHLSQSSCTSASRSNRLSSTKRQIYSQLDLGAWAGQGPMLCDTPTQGRNACFSCTQEQWLLVSRTHSCAGFGDWRGGQLSQELCWHPAPPLPRLLPCQLPKQSTNHSGAWRWGRPEDRWVHQTTLPYLAEVGYLLVISGYTGWMLGISPSNPERIRFPQ